MYVILPPQSRLLIRALLLTVGLYASTLSLGAQEADNSPSSPSIGAKATAPLALTLEQAVRLALDKSPSLQAVHLGAERSQGKCSQDTCWAPALGELDGQLLLYAEEAEGLLRRWR